MSNHITPNNREVLYAVGLTNRPEELLSTNGSLDVYITGGAAGGTQYTELSTTSPGVGNLSLARYQTAPPSLTNGQMYGLQLDSAGNLKVTGSISVGGTTDNSAFTAGTSTGTPAMGFYHSTIDTVTDGRSAAVGITSKRALLVNLQNASGVEIGTSTTPVQVSLANTGANTSKLLVTADPITFASAQAVTQSGTWNIATVTTLTGITNALPAGSNVIGHIITDTGSTTAVTGTVTTSEAAPTTVLNGKTNVTTAGSRVVLAASTACKSVTIKALAANTGSIYVGSVTVAASNGFALLAGESVSLDIANLNTVNIDSSVNGEGVTYLGVN